MNSDRLRFMKKRIIDTFPARHLKGPDNQDSFDSLSEYSLRKNYGLELRKRRKNRSNIKI